MMEGLLSLHPVKSLCSWLSSQDANSTGSDCWSMMKRRLLLVMTACMNSCGDTWEKARRKQVSAAVRVSDAA